MKEVTGSDQLSKVVIKGFKSIESCDLELGSLNVLIGANGAGKSNFIDFFRMIQQILESNLQVFVSRQGGPDTLLHFGRKQTKQLEIELYFGKNNSYFAKLEPTQDNRLMFIEESSFWNARIGGGHFETKAGKWAEDQAGQDILQAMKRWRVYHFHDTSESAYVKQVHKINDNAYLRPDASNLAAFLYLLQETHPKSYRHIERTIQLIAPFFGGFNLRPSFQNKETIELEWFEQGQDVPFKAHTLSDGTLRFICLATVFLQPEEYKPATILVDEPELGLHPYAITVLASFIKAAAYDNQVIVSTQSVDLLNEFDPQDVIVVDRDKSKSILKRLGNEQLEAWLEDYSLGELWKKNVFGGRPAR
jgi:predicted ATPase